jgi:hypothetical protein
MKRLKAAQGKSVRVLAELRGFFSRSLVKNFLLARRLVERGRRFVEFFH